MRITAHCIVKNEDIWVWYAIQSVLPFVEKILVYDTGSTDNTIKIIELINSAKIEFIKKGKVTPSQLVNLRQEQLDKTKSDWFLILDGDEIWPKDQLIKLQSSAKNASKNTIAVFNRVRNCIGDVFHVLPDEAGDYQIADKKGNLNIRLIRKTKNLKVVGEYPLESYEDQNGSIQNQVNNLIYSEAWYLHTSFLKRSSKDIKKTSGSFGRRRFPQKGKLLKFEDLPEVFNIDRPNIVANPFKRRGVVYESAAKVFDPLIYLKRKINE